MSTDKNTTLQQKIAGRHQEERADLRQLHAPEDLLKDDLKDPLLEDSMPLESSVFGLTAELDPSSDDDSENKNSHKRPSVQNSEPSSIENKTSESSSSLFEGIRSHFNEAVSPLVNEDSLNQNTTPAQNALFGGLLKALAEPEHSSLEKLNLQRQNIHLQQNTASEQIKNIERLQDLEPRLQMEQLQKICSTLKDCAKQMQEIKNSLDPSDHSTQAQRVLLNDLNRTIHAVEQALPHTERALHSLLYVNPSLADRDPLSAEQHEIDQDVDFFAHLLQGALLLADIHGSSVSRLNPRSATHQSNVLLSTPQLSTEIEHTIQPNEEELEAVASEPEEDIFEPSTKP
ncbi:MAG: hypothetical protein CMK59_02590 [Proteobacteria bacterium]|nr:hypothetical protein [Pseudomonadota bacterium]